ncbi:DEAD/DEAH box helicase [Halalkalirubrum salinum]|uniref:DEAD/DEAH box helicase n=1 Tax=Halalkalirubrum salinum TaxID=2563889 RepID=UPI0010FB7853|nr:DEAD/DEAH box helicase family protein [Halalkalirubrum salinum]
MGRRFPPPIIGVVVDEERYRAIVKIATTDGDDLPQSVFVERCQSEITKSNSDEQYSESYMKRILAAYAELGVTTRDQSGEQTTIKPSPFAENFLRGELSLDEFIWKSLKRSWVAMGNRPEGIEALDQVLRTIEKANRGIKKGEIESQLANDHDYEFNDQGIRGYPEILQILGAIEKNDHTYDLGKSGQVDKYKRRFRNADIFGKLESRLNREGATVEPPRQSAKRDLMKYYMYREAGGWQKRRQWYNTFWRDYLKSETRKGQTGSDLRRKDKYRDFTNKKKELREQIRSRYSSLKNDSLSGLSASVLERITTAESEDEAKRIRVAAGSGISRADLQLLEDESRGSYCFANSFELYDWQSEAADMWFTGTSDQAPEQGIVQVVTGAGKTVMALDILRQWLTENSDRIATIVVPTNVLMRQWLTELVSTLNIPVDEVGWAGGGHKDNFKECRVLVTIVNSAVQNEYLRTALRQVDNPEHLLIADECHRYTGDKFSNIFDYPRSASLGLSATAISRTSDDRNTDDEHLVQELGEIYYELSYDEGIKRGLIPEFTIQYIGFDLAPQEKAQYDRLSQKVSDAVKDIRQQYGHRLNDLPGGFARKLQIIRNEADRPTPAIADYFESTQERRELVDNAAARQAITLKLLRNTIENADKAIVFQERIEQLEQLIAPLDQRGIDARTGELATGAEDYRANLYNEFEGLKQVDQQIEELFADPDYWPVMYHSGHSRKTWNDLAMEWFRQDGMADVMLSVKALIEGVDVPSADVGIVRVSSSSIRQRIQTLGRILRTSDETEEQSILYVLYAKDTVDERIFTQYDWQTELASAHVEHKIWEPDAEEGLAEGQIRDADPEEYPPRPEPEIIPDPDNLDIGDPYEGQRDPIRQVSVDSRGQLFEHRDMGRRYLSSDGFEEAVDFVMQKKGGGTIFVNKHNHLLTVLPDGPVFLGTVEGPEVFESKDSGEESGNGLQDSLNRGSLTEEPDDFDELF